MKCRVATLSTPQLNTHVKMRTHITVLLWDYGDGEKLFAGIIIYTHAGYISVVGKLVSILHW